MEPAPGQSLEARVNLGKQDVEIAGRDFSRIFVKSPAWRGFPSLMNCLVYALF